MRGAVTPERFWLAAALFHLLVLMGVRHVAAVWRDPLRCGRPIGRWLATLARDVFALAVFTYLASLLATVAANIGYDLGRVHVGPITLRLLGQALFVEGTLLAIALACRHGGACRALRAAALALSAVVVLAVNVDAYYVEPRRIVLRHHSVGAEPGAAGPALRILHISDIQTPSIGSHEEKALAAGLRHRPDLIVLTGDYVQDAMGRATEAGAAADLRALIRRIGFTAPLGVFATEGDVGPPCAVVVRGDRRTLPRRCVRSRPAARRKHARHHRPVARPGAGTRSACPRPESWRRRRRPTAVSSSRIRPTSSPRCRSTWTSSSPDTRTEGRW